MSLYTEKHFPAALKCEGVQSWLMSCENVKPAEIRSLNLGKKLNKLKK